MEIMFDVYSREVRSVLELAVPVWHSGLTRQQAVDIERIQKISFKIMLGERYFGYKSACKIFSAHTLEDRRLTLCKKIAYKILKSDNCLFEKVGTDVNTRQRSDLVKEYKCNTGHYQKSSLEFLAKLINTSEK